MNRLQDQTKQDTAGFLRADGGFDLISVVWIAGLLAVVATAFASLETAADDECVFSLTFTFASGKVLERPDTDICQTDGMIVE